MNRRWLLGAAVVLVGAVGLVFGLSARAKATRPHLSETVLARAAEPASFEPWPHVKVAWTGVAGLRVELPGHTLLIDPYVTRHAMAELARPLDVDEPTVARAFPVADTILVGHSHHDHVADVASIARRTGAIVHGSQTTCAITTALGLPPTQCVVFADTQRFDAGPFEIEPLESGHGRTMLGVPFDGELTEPPTPPLGVRDMPMGGAYAFVIRARSVGVVLYHQGSAGLNDALLDHVRDLEPEAAYIGVALRDRTENFADRLLGAMHPHTVSPIHHDDFFGGVLDDDVPLMSGVDLPGFEADVTRILGRGHYVAPEPFRRHLIVPPDDAPDFGRE